MIFTLVVFRNRRIIGSRFSIPWTVGGSGLTTQTACRAKANLMSSGFRCPSRVENSVSLTTDDYGRFRQFYFKGKKR